MNRTAAPLVAAAAAASVSACLTSRAQPSRADWSSWLPFWSPSEDVASDADASLRSGASGMLMVWGGPGFGRKPRPVEKIPPVRRVAIHDELCAAVTENGAVYTVVPEYNEDGTRTTAARGCGAPNLSVEVLENTGVARVRDVALRGNAEIALLGENGSVSVVRRNQSSGSWEPGRVLSGAMRRARIDLLRCGERHCVAIASDGSAYAWGDNSKGQCGAGGLETKEKVSEVGEQQPLRVQTPPRLQVVDVDCGDEHTSLLAQSGVLYACGDDHWMQLGVTTQPWVKGEHKIPGDVHISTCVEDVAGKSVSCGGQYTVMVARDGTPWSWGENSHGQLGHHNIVSFAPPNPIANFQLRAATSRAGRHHTCIVAEDGTIYCIGEGMNGQLGSGPLQRTSVWREVRKLSSSKGLVVALAAGGDGSAAILSQ